MDNDWRYPYFRTAPLLLGQAIFRWGISSINLEHKKPAERGKGTSNGVVHEMAIDQYKKTSEI